MSTPSSLRNQETDRGRRGPGGAAPSSRLIRTNELDRARAVISDVYVPHELKSYDGRKLDFKFHFLRSSRLTLGYLYYGADTELIIPPMQNHYHVNLTIDGKTLVTQADRRGATIGAREGAAFRPCEDFTARWSPDAQQDIILLSRSAVENHLGSLLNRPVDAPIDFALTFDLTTAAGQGLSAGVRFLRSELARPGGLSESPLARGQLESYVLTQLLLAIPHRYAAELRTQTRPAQRNRIGAVVDLIEAQPEADLTIATMAEVAGVSARALQVGFQHAIGETPTAYVRRVRLERVRSELVATVGERSITDIALAWGFSHLGRFSAYYRQQFGETPTETVRQALRE